MVPQDGTAQQVETLTIKLDRRRSGKKGVSDGTGGVARQALASELIDDGQTPELQVVGSRVEDKVVGPT